MCIANINFLNRFLIIYFYTEIKSHAEPILYSIKNIIFSISYEFATMFYEVRHRSWYIFKHNKPLEGTYTALETVVVYKNKINKLCLESMAFFIRSKIIFINLIGNIYWWSKIHF